MNKVGQKEHPYFDGENLGPKQKQRKETLRDWPISRRHATWSTWSTCQVAGPKLSSKSYSTRHDLGIAGMMLVLDGFGSFG